MPDLNAAARAFVRWALQDGPWEGCDLDGGSVQEKALTLGLIKTVPYDPVAHDDAGAEYDVEPGADWYVLADEMKN